MTANDLTARPAAPTVASAAPAGVMDAPPPPPVPRQPRRWKMWLLTCAAIYPVITGLGYSLAAVGASLPLWARFVIMVPIAVALLVFVVLPVLTKAFFGWITR